jgi:hypothetical protein
VNHPILSRVNTRSPAGRPRGEGQPASDPLKFFFGAVDHDRRAAILGGSPEWFSNRSGDLILGNSAVRSLLVSAGTRSCTGNQGNDRSFIVVLQHDGGRRHLLGTIYSTNRQIDLFKVSETTSPWAGKPAGGESDDPIN